MPIVLLLILLVGMLLGIARHNRKTRQRNRAALNNEVLPAGHISANPYPAFEVPRGDYGANVYVYDGTPLVNSLHGAHYKLEVIPGVVGMRSVYTGTVWQGPCCLAYKHNPIGYIAESAYFDAIKMIVDSEYAVTVHAVTCGTDPGGWPIVRLEVPSYEWFKERGYWPYKR